MVDFLRYKVLYFLISALILVPGIFSLVRWGLKPSIDFTGGTVWEVKFDQPSNEEDLRKGLKDKVGKFSQLRSSGEREYVMRFAPLSKEEKGAVEDFLNQQGTYTEVRYEQVGPLLGQELLFKTVVGVVLAAVLIMIYVAWRFKDKMYGVCAILAMFHDSLIVLGTFSLLGHFAGVEVDTLFVTALLTVLSFSVHDTVVVYDQIRELNNRYPKRSFNSLINEAISTTLVRSVNNSLTIIFMLLALLLLGGSSTRWFVVALLVGTLAGTYSSTFTAAPLLAVWKEKLG